MPARETKPNIVVPLFVLTVLLVIPSHAAEVVYSFNRGAWTRASRRWLARSFHLSSAFSFLWMIALLLLREGGSISASSACGLEEMNPDIAGIGIRIALYVPQILTIFTLVLGHYHTESVGLKGLCNLQLLGMRRSFFPRITTY